MLKEILTFGLRRMITFGVDKSGGVWRLPGVDYWSKGDRHNAQCLGLKKLHTSSNIFFHELSYLLFCAIIWPFLPWCLISLIFTVFFLHINLQLMKKGMWINSYLPLQFKHLVTSIEQMGISVTSGATALAPPSLLMLNTCKVNELSQSTNI